MTEERWKLLVSILVYVTIVALVAFVLFHQTIVKQTRATEHYRQGEARLMADRGSQASVPIPG